MTPDSRRSAGLTATIVHSLLLIGYRNPRPPIDGRRRPAVIFDRPEKANADRGSGASRMSQLNLALDRLDSAIDRLQSAISTREQRAGVAQERLTVELRDVKATHAILEAEARNVSTRLDAVIGRLKTLLES